MGNNILQWNNNNCLVDFGWASKCYFDGWSILHFIFTAAIYFVLLLIIHFRVKKNKIRWAFVALIVLNILHVIEDILETGTTLKSITELLQSRKVSSLEIVTLLDKPNRRKADIEAKYVGKKIPDEFVIGYGLDYGELYRNLPYIGTLKPEVYSK